MAATLTTPFPASMDVDYVRIWQKGPASTTSALVLESSVDTPTTVDPNAEPIPVLELPIPPATEVVPTDSTNSSALDLSISSSMFGEEPVL